MFSVRGPFPFGFGAPIDDDDVDDLRKLLELDESVLESAKRTLAGQPSFLTRRQLQESLASGVDDSTAADMICRVIRWVERLRRPDGRIDRAFQVLRELPPVEKEGETPTEVFSEKQLAALQIRVESLFACAPGLQRQSKAESLEDATGQRLKRIRLICDLRPIFDSERQQIEGVMPLTTLSAVCEGVNGLPVGFEAILSERDVENLCEMATMAKQKLASLRRLAASSNFPIPSVDLTEFTTKTNDAN